MMMNRTHILTAFIALGFSGSHLVGQEDASGAHSTHAALYPPKDIQWVDGPASLPPGSKMAILEGDPTAEGMFVMRVRVPDGYHIPAHTHPKPERVTVISGIFKLAMGDNLQEGDARALPAGTYGVWPAGMVHAAWTEGETVLQIHGIGPWAINYIDPADDPREARKSE